MKRGTIVGIIVGVVLVGGVTAGVVVAAGGGAGDSAVPGASEPAPTPTRADPQPLPTPTTDGEEGTDDASGADDGATATPGAYVPFTDEALASAEGDRVLFFHASWCPSCRALEESILAEGVPDGVTILKVDYDERQDLRQQYEVRQQTTVVLLDENGDAAALFVPYDEPTIDNALAGLGLPG